MSRLEIYAVEHNGDHWQSVFPTAESAKSQNHTTIADALDYMIKECQVYQPITVFPFEPRRWSATHRQKYGSEQA